jgi:hypothetical protein
LKIQDDEKKCKIVFKSSLSNNKIEKTSENLIQDKIKTFFENKVINKKIKHPNKKETENDRKKVLIRNFENEFDDIRFKNKKLVEIEKVTNKENCNNFKHKVEKQNKIVSIPLNLCINSKNENQLTKSRNKAETIIETTLQNCYNPVNNYSNLILNSNF